MFVKLCFGSLVRRLELSDVTFSALVTLIENSFSVYGVTVTYVDEDGDEVAVLSDEELIEAIETSKRMGLKTTKLFIKVANEIGKVSTSAVEKVLVDDVIIASNKSTESNVEFSTTNKLSNESMSKPSLSESSSSRMVNEDIGSEYLDSIAHQDVVHLGVSCDCCGQSPLTGIRFKCSVCSDFDLCYNCHLKNNHAFEHFFYVIKEASDSLPESLKNVTAIGSNVENCTAKSLDYDSNSLAEAISSFAREFAGSVNGKSQSIVPSSKIIHTGISCSVCNISSILGARFSCSVCKNLNLCSQCSEKHNPEHPLIMMKIPKEEVIPVHPNIGCNECNMLPIIGSRYKCNECSDFDLCTSCVSKGIHDKSHQMTVMKLPEGNDGSYGSKNSIMTTCNFPAVSSSVNGSRKQRRIARAAAFGATLGELVSSVCQTIQGRCQTFSCGVQRDDLKAKFVSHVTIFDKSGVKPNSYHTKIWKVQNNCDLRWPRGCKMVSVGGYSLADKNQSFSILECFPGEVIEISINFTAPESAGRYTQYFRMTTIEGCHFGNPLWIDVTVVNEISSRIDQVCCAAETVPFSCHPIPLVESISNFSLSGSQVQSVNSSSNASYLTPAVTQIQASSFSDDSAHGSNISFSSFQNDVEKSAALFAEEINKSADNFVAELNKGQISREKSSNSVENLLANAVDSAREFDPTALNFGGLGYYAAYDLYSSEINQLLDMGFYDFNANLNLLVTHKGNIATVVQELLLPK